MSISDGKQHEHVIGRRWEKHWERERDEELFSKHIDEKQYACFRYPWQPYAMNWVWKMHGNTADTLFMFDSGAEGLSVCETERDCDTVCLCVYKGERNRVKEAEG